MTNFKIATIFIPFYREKGQNILFLNHIRTENKFIFALYFQIISGIPLRQLCLLRCVMLVQERAKKLEVICREVINEYKRLTNDFDRSMQVSDDSILCRDLDELIFMSVIKLKNGTDVGQFEFRYVLRR